MASELEDFLRRAAQRRAENAASRTAPPQPQRPQYTDRRRERMSSSGDFDEDDDDVVLAEAVPATPEPPRHGGNPQSRDSRNQPTREGMIEPVRLEEPVALEQPVRLGEVVGLDEFATGRLGDRMRNTSGQGGHSRKEGPSPRATYGEMPGGGAAPVAGSAPVVQALLRLITDPHGIHQAILSREILDRPTHRW